MLVKTIQPDLSAPMREVLDDLSWYPAGEIWCLDVNQKVLGALLMWGLVRPKEGRIESAGRFYFELTELGVKVNEWIRERGAKG